MVSMRQLVFLIFFMVVAPRLAVAQDEIDRVVVAPIVYVGVDDPAIADTARQAAVRGIEAELRSQPQFQLISQTQLRRLIHARPSYQESLALASSWADLGITKYKELDAEGAVKSLEQAVAIYKSVRWDLVEPLQMAEVIMYLALAHLDLKRDLARPLELMAEMIRLDPTRVLKAGFYPDDVVQFYDSAHETVERAVRDGSDVQRARALADLAESRHVVTLSILPSNNGYEVIMHWYDARAGGFLPAESLRVLSLVESTVEESGSRLTSRFVACLLTPSKISSEVQSSKGDSPWAIELSFAYASFLVFPEDQVELFGNYGANVGASFLLTREFALIASGQVLTSIRDNDGFLNDDFTTLRGFGGIELGYAFGPLRVEVGVSVEGATVGSIKVCRDINKIITGCDDDPADYTLHDYDLLVGINARPRLTVQVVKSFKVLVGASGSFYFFPLSERSLNLPLTVELGVQYRF